MISKDFNTYQSSKNNRELILDKKDSLTISDYKSLITSSIVTLDVTIVNAPIITLLCIIAPSSIIAVLWILLKVFFTYLQS